MFEVVAVYTASSINIRQCKSQLPLKILFSDSDELYLKNGDKKFVYIFQSFFNHTENEKAKILDALSAITKENNTPQFTDTIQVEIIEGRQQVAFDKSNPAQF
jgi:hypothetical protein